MTSILTDLREAGQACAQDLEQLDAALARAKDLPNLAQARALVELVKTHERLAKLTAGIVHLVDKPPPAPSFPAFDPHSNGSNGKGDGRSKRA